MNRGDEYVFHSAVESSFAVAVNRMWKLCKAGDKSPGGASYGGESAEFGTNFKHQGSGGNLVRTGELAQFSTSAKSLLLLLVL